MDSFHFQWHITDRCNLRCVHCYQDKHTQAGELDTAGLISVAENITSAFRSWGVRGRIMLTGGEPFIRKDIWELARFLDASPDIEQVGFITNGTIVHNYLEGLSSLGKLGEIHVSLDGSTPAVNDNIRGKSVFRDTCANIRLLKKNGFTVVVMFTLMRRNYNDAPNLYSMVKELGADGYIIERFIPLGSGRGIKDEFITAGELKKLFAGIYENCDAEFTRDAARYHAVQVRFNKDGSEELLGALCIAGTDGGAILPDGTMLPCRRFCLPVGNLLREKLEDIWESSRVLNDIRDSGNLKGKCRSCSMAGCRGCRAAVYAVTGDYLGEDIQCWL